MYYELDSRPIPRPKQFSRAFVSVSDDLRAIDGKEGRDIRMRKERFVLSWSTLTTAEVSLIQSIADQGVPVTFSVTDRDFVILQTSVIVRISSVEYTTPGSDYYSSMAIELEEVS